MAQIRHMAIATDDPKKLGDYYADVFGLTITGTGSHGDVWLTDGNIDIALIPHSAESPYKTGFNHFGFTLEESEKPDVYARMGKYGITPFKPPVDRPYVEEKGRDIDGNVFDLATSSVLAEPNGQVKEKPIHQPA